MEIVILPTSNITNITTTQRQHFFKITNTKEGRRKNDIIWADSKISSVHNLQLKSTWYCWSRYLPLAFFLLSSFLRAASNSSSVGSGTAPSPPYLLIRDDSIEFTLPFLSFCRWAMMAYKSSDFFFDLQKGLFLCNER